MRQKTFMDPGRQWDRTVELWRQDRFGQNDVLIGPDWPILCVFTRHHKVFSQGDVVLALLLSGDCRWGVVGKTRKGRDIHSPLWISTSGVRGPMKSVKWPGDLVGKRLDDPGARRFAVEIAHAHVPNGGPASPVGVSVDNPSRQP